MKSIFKIPLLLLLVHVAQAQTEPAAGLKMYSL